MTYIKPNTSGLPINLNSFTTIVTPVTNVGQLPIQPKSGSALVEAFNPKRAARNPKLSHIAFVLDESGSMGSRVDATISGFNEYLKSQEEDAEANGIETLVSLYKFNGTEVSCVIDREDVKKVEPLNRRNYRPSGGTNLLDAIGAVMMKVNETLSAKQKKDRESVSIVILTDGAENMSRLFGNDDIKAMVKKSEEKNWGFMFLGANIDAFATGQGLGFTPQNTLQFNATNVTETFRSASSMTSRMKSAYAAGQDTSAVYASTAFTPEERSSAVGDTNVKDTV